MAKQLNLEFADGQIRVQDFPDAIAVVKPVGNFKANRVLKDLSLHQHDLQMAQNALHFLNNIQIQDVRVFLWEYAVIRVMKCFKRSESREKLSSKTIFHGDLPALATFKFFESLRDKYLAHDDNAYCDSVVGLIVASEQKAYPIEKVITITAFAVTLSPENFSNFSLLIERVLGWVTSRYEEVATEITEHYQEKGREALLKFPHVTYTALVGPEDVHRNRRNE